ncbi:MAG: hypothetical protein COA79_05940 [Planctomycetota bacterium]|nr:MAG: hypothetical protein COA79_05940 [Planctomycetota bacterium]
MNVRMLSGEGLTFVLALLAIGAIVFFIFVYRIESKNTINLNPKKKWLLWIFRVLIALMILFALAKPSVKTTQTEVRNPVVAFILDQSSSMLFPTSPDNPFVKNLTKKEKTRYKAAKLAIEELTMKLHKTHDIRIYGFSDTLNLLSAINMDKDGEKPLDIKSILKTKNGEESDAVGQYSNVGDGLNDTMRELSSNQISSIVLLSDGRETGGEPLKQIMKRAAKAAVKVHSVVFGTEFPLRDLSIDEIIAPAEASLGDTLTLNVKITNQISAVLQTKLQVFEEDELVAEKTVRLKRGQTVIPVNVVPETEGTRKFIVKLPLQNDEINVKNNEDVVHVKVIKRSIRIIMIVGQPSLEYYYLLPALLRDPVIDISCYLQSADVDYTHQGNKTIKELPKTLAEWQKYDVCVFMDVDATEISPPQINGLENMVNKGGGLLVVGGRTSGISKLVQVHGAKIRSMLPIDIDPNYFPNHDKVYSTPFKLLRTRLGKAHPIMMASTNEQINKKVWDTFPEFYWTQPIKGVKGGAISLLEIEGKGKKSSAMAIHRYGEGAVFYSGVSNFWRWRFPYENYDYDRFWVRAIRYLGETKLLGGQKAVALSTERKIYNPGEKVKVQLRILDPALLSQLKGVPVFAQVTTPDKDNTMVALKPDPTGEPMYMGEYLAKSTGSMLVESKQAAPGGDSQQKPLFDVKHSFKVERTSLEDKDTSADLELMKALADKTEGKYFDYNNMSTFGSIVEAIPKEPQVLTKDISQEVWDKSFFLIIFLVVIVAEWCLRKWWGLL